MEPIIYAAQLIVVKGWTHEVTWEVQEHLHWTLNNMIANNEIKIVLEEPGLFIYETLDYDPTAGNNIKAFVVQPSLKMDVYNICIDIPD